MQQPAGFEGCAADQTNASAAADASPGEVQEWGTGKTSYSGATADRWRPFGTRSKVVMDLVGGDDDDDDDDDDGDNVSPFREYIAGATGGA
ncbi:hypothetical protein Dda_2542 [Drechslerella dactyloides]|uniref:Uncharacterized protein n=1 Tax=Drechslerella dactyloides TaxID=74499 RepID=A0AAD6NM24_DREDA|nr:hypothetical protein Dda_2542 [Drechslerella dactyloides]